MDKRRGIKLKNYLLKYKIYIKAAAVSVAIIVVAFIGYGWLHRPAGTLPDQQNDQKFSHADDVEDEDLDDDSHNHNNDYDGTKERGKAKSKKRGSSSSKDAITVDITGEVANPNVYGLAEGSRVKDLIEAAGGLTENADISKINRARPLKDGEKIYIRSKEEAANGGDSSANVADTDAENTGTGDSKVNINTATKEQLIALPDIGPAMADRILEFRQNNGQFSSIDQLSQVKGIGANRLNKLKNYLTI